MSLVAYFGEDEVLVCDKKDEKKMLKEWFNTDEEDRGRDPEGYDRYETLKDDPVVHIRHSFNHGNMSYKD